MHGLLRVRCFGYSYNAVTGYKLQADSIRGAVFSAIAHTRQAREALFLYVQCNDYAKRHRAGAIDCHPAGRDIHTGATIYDAVDWVGYSHITCDGHPLVSSPIGQQVVKRSCALGSDAESVSLQCSPEPEIHVVYCSGGKVNCP